MARIPRSAFPQYGVFHVTTRTAGGIAIARDDLDRARWMRLRAFVERECD